MVNKDELQIFIKMDVAIGHNLVFSSFFLLAYWSRKYVLNFDIIILDGLQIRFCINVNFLIIYSIEFIYLFHVHNIYADNILYRRTI